MARTYFDLDTVTILLSNVKNAERRFRNHLVHSRSVFTDIVYLNNHAEFGLKALRCYLYATIVRNRVYTAQLHIVYRKIARRRRRLNMLQRVVDDNLKMRRGSRKVFRRRPVCKINCKRVRRAISIIANSYAKISALAALVQSRS